ncbi:hypothetical protein ACHAXA_006437 [Cyclostephanos tholiformis]|uniref:RING-type domain-containing protein n=1 Tax=Cyclostephanos tholiformis TaxID=382380 RepID=A0ABD3SF90_9STRA
MEREYEEDKKREMERRGKEMEAFMNSMMNGGGGGGGDEGTGSGGMCTTATRGAEAMEGDYDGDVVDDGIPYACHICRGPFVNPIVTACGHYLDEKCMLNLIRESGGNTSCPVCSKDTHGVLNHPTKLVAKKRRLVGRDGTWEDYMEKKQRSGGKK